MITVGLRVRHNWKRESILLTTILRISSGTFLLALQIAWAEEWEKITGAREVSSACRAVCHYHYYHHHHYHYHYHQYLDRGVGQVHDDPQLVHLLHHCLQIEKPFLFFFMRIFRIGARNGSDIPGQNSLAAINLSRLSRSSGLLIPIRSSGGSECQVHKQTSHSALWGQSWVCGDKQPLTDICPWPGPLARTVGRKGVRSYRLNPKYRMIVG